MKRTRTFRLVLLAFSMVALLTSACAGPPESSSPTTSSSTPEGIARLAAPFRDYQLGTRRPGGGACTETTSVAPSLRYVESLEYTGAPPVTFGMDGDCIREIRTDYAMRDGRFEHALSFASQRLGSPAGEDRAICIATGEEIHAVYWDQPEGRFQVVRVGTESQPEFVLLSATGPAAYSRHCEGGVRR